MDGAAHVPRPARTGARATGTLDRRSRCGPPECLVAVVEWCGSLERRGYGIGLWESGTAAGGIGDHWRPLGGVMMKGSAATYSRASYTGTTIGKAAFDGRVRDGIGSGRCFMATVKGVG